MKYKQFIFDQWHFEVDSKTLSLHYCIDEELYFTESFRFDFKFAEYDQEAFNRAAQLLFIMAGISYYKTFLPPEIIIKQGSLTEDEATFFNKTYQKGLGEFFYVNGLDPNTMINFPIDPSKNLNSLSISSDGSLVGVGGGKDSLVSVELLRDQPETATWSVGHRNQLAPLIEKIALPHYWIERSWDKQLLELNDKGAYNGHVPISAILACVGAMIAVLTGRRDVVVSNENSANEPTLHHKNSDINHQYSKSLEFEKDFQQILRQNFKDSVRYYSSLRPFSELKIAEIFARVGFEKYKDAFSSCNRAFTNSSDKMFWCCECPKCAFVFLALTPFVDRHELESVFHGKNLLLDPILEPTYRQLLGIEGEKPLECVGEIKESRSAMRLAAYLYPELEKYQFEIPPDYNYAAINEHAMPDEIWSVISRRTSS